MCRLSLIGYNMFNATMLFAQISFAEMFIAILCKQNIFPHHPTHLPLQSYIFQGSDEYQMQQYFSQTNFSASSFLVSPFRIIFVRHIQVSNYSTYWDLSLRQTMVFIRLFLSLALCYQHKESAFHLQPL